MLPLPPGVAVRVRIGVMRNRVVTTAFAVGIVSLLLVTAPAFAAGPGAIAASKRCGNTGGQGIGLSDVRAIVTTCPSARDVARQWLRNVLARRCSRFYCRSYRYTCRAEPPARVRYRVNCAKRGGRRVGFTVVAD